MQNPPDISTNIIIWLIATALIIHHQWRGKTLSVGIPFCFLFLLITQYFFGALIHLFPWLYSPTNTYYVQLGFNETTYSVIAFTIGSIIICPILLKNLQLPGLKFKPQPPDLGLAQSYIYLGLLFWFVFTPLFIMIPSVKSVVISGNLLLLIGLCLACWQAWYLQNKQTLIRLLIIMGTLPIITIFTAGYLSGATLLVFVLSFIFWFYRPRWQAILALFLALYLGFSIFVTYYRDRGEIRNIVWGRQGWEARIDKFMSTASNFEFFNPTNPEHLEKISLRMNESVLVGNAIEYMRSGNIPFGQGETMMAAFAAVVPRIFWPDKPAVFGGFDLVAKYTGSTEELKLTSGTTSIAAGLTFEFYVNFGRIGVFIGFLILGIIYKYIDAVASLRLISGDWRGFMNWYLPAIGAIPSSNVAEIVSNAAVLIVLVIFLNSVKIPNFLKGKVSRKDQYKLYLIQQENANNFPR